MFVSDSLPFAEYADPWVLLAGMATRTESITLGTWLVPVPRRQPTQLAQEIATLDRFSEGHVLFGAGLGNANDYESYGRPYDPPDLAARFDESLDVITGLWRGEPFTYDGDHFTLDEATVEPTPVQQPRVPILAGAWWPNKKPFHRGARWDGIMPFMASLTGDGTGPHGERATGSPMEEVRDMLEYYQRISEDPCEILLPYLSPEDRPDYLDTCEELGTTWLLSTDVPGTADPLQRIQAGPPR